MTPLLEKLPTILVLAVLVGIFLSLRKHAPSARIRLWTYAWALIFLHFFIQAFETHTGTLETVLESIDITALELSGVVFVVSMLRLVEGRGRRLGLLALLGISVGFHAFAASFNWQIPWTMSTALAIIFFVSAVLALLARPLPRFNIGVSVVLVAAGIWAVHNQLHGSPDFAINAILTISFGLCGLLFWKRYPRPSAGVIAVSGGFLAWGAVFPVGALLDHYLPKLQMNPEIWNVPKYFVAFGMVLTLLEDKSRIIEQSSAREHAENLLLQRLSHITSRLLAGKDPAALCNEVATAVTDASGFSKAALLLSAEDRSFHLAGANGFSVEESKELKGRAGNLTIEQLKALCSKGNQLGNNSYHMAHSDNEVLIPLISWRGSYVGCLFLRCTEPSINLDKSEMVKLEVLASDLAVTIENTRLHHQLVRAEKLAALGQLVAGVAHELNNPLTGIIGYSELLAEEVQEEKVVKRLQKLGHEAHRMKRIVDGLLRFARQNNPAMRAADLDSALRDVIQLREYHLRKLGIHVESHIDPELPPIAIGEDELKQVLLNLLNNSMDAVEDSVERSIQIRASRHQNTVVIQFEDSGPGFADLNRAFDPFFTTKPVGKGTGLGLSICYGIAQECGGEIALANKQLYGASVVLELPVAVSAGQPTIALSV
ncbi:MAG TPA: ATP-binding protein [Candidatus Acidoferrales bacterium]|nr:ATP-binding protein [Candidatus Acidoferrales bacterium]